MRVLNSLIILVLTLVLSASSALATSPILNGHESDHGFTAYYPDGLHGVVGEEGITHEGEDLVIEISDTKNFYQWFYGTSSSEGQHGEFSIWQRKRGPDCPAGFKDVPNASDNWGSYLLGGDYCVQTTQFDAGSVPFL